MTPQAKADYRPPTTWDVVPPTTYDLGCSTSKSPACICTHVVMVMGRFRMVRLTKKVWVMMPVM